MADTRQLASDLSVKLIKYVISTSVNAVRLHIAASTFSKHNTQVQDMCTVSLD